ncbi:MAG: molybdenum cofactor guanylyltransferase [Planctomycetes bacterium]|nr:molybdenum cofactor guanylyltransferase [Planctomycetota bacterium]
MPDKVGMRIGAVILTGGRGQRMGRAKESLPFGGRPLLAHVVHNLQPAADAILVVARDPDQELPALPDDVLVTSDERDGGPLAGLAAGLRALQRDAGFGDDDVAFATACDMPFVDAALVRWLLAHLPGHTVVMPRAADVLQPLCALYRLSMLPHANALLDAGERTPRSLARHPDAAILAQAEFSKIDPRGRYLRNVNTPADYEAALAEFEQP